jgi:hypothetical protein
MLKGVFSQLLSKIDAGEESTTPVNDITNMVRKRPAPDVEETTAKEDKLPAEPQLEEKKVEDEEPSEKKAKVE